MSGKGCKKGKTVYLRSGAFKGTSSGGQGFGFVKTTAKAGGTFSAQTTIPQTRMAGTYAVFASCQISGHFAVERLTVT